MELGFVLTTILILNTSIVAACTPHLRPFFLSLHTTQNDIAELPHLKTMQYPSSTYVSRSYGSVAARSTPRTPIHSKADKSRRPSRIWLSNAQDLSSDKGWKFERLDPNTFALKLRPDDTGKRSTTVTTCQMPESKQDAGDAIGHTVEFSLEFEMIPKSRDIDRNEKATKL